MIFNSRSYSILDLIPPLCNSAYQNLRSYSIMSYSLDLIPPSSLSQQYRLYKLFNLDIHQMKMTNLNLNEIFLKCSHLSDGPSSSHCWPRMRAMGSPWPFMGPLGMSQPSVKCTGVSVRLRFFLQQYQKIYWLFWKISAGITPFH